VCRGHKNVGNGTLRRVHKHDMTVESEKNRTVHGSPSKEEAKCYLEPNTQDNRKQRTARNS